MSRKRLRKKWIRVLLGSVGVLALGAFGFVLWQPWEYDLIEKKRPESDPRVNPDPERLFRKGARVAVVVAHPDDPEFYIGGVLTLLHRAGAEIHLILATDGDKGYYPFEDAERNSRIRRAEQLEAGGRYGAKALHWLGFPDGRVRATDELRSSIRDKLQQIKPEYVLSFDPEHPTRRRHRDHRVVGLATYDVVKNGRIGQWYLGFMTAAPNYAVDVTAVWAAKRELLALHKSQFSGERLTMIYDLVGGRARSYGKEFGFDLAEAFRVTPIGTVKP